VYVLVIVGAFFAVLGTDQNLTDNLDTTDARVAKLQQQVDTLLCAVTVQAWKERGRIIDGLTLASIRFVEHSTLPGRRHFLDEFAKYHQELQRQLRSTRVHCVRRNG